MSNGDKQDPNVQSNQSGSPAVPTTGTVKWFQSLKGFGFIQADDDQRDIFVHHTSLNMDGYRTLEQGQRVRFDMYTGDKGPIAQNVEVI